MEASASLIRSISRVFCVNLKSKFYPSSSLEGTGKLFSRCRCCCWNLLTCAVSSRGGHRKHMDHSLHGGVGPEDPLEMSGTLDLLPPMAPGRMDPVSWYRHRILDTQPWDTRSWREMTQGRTPWWAISTIWWRMWLGRGRPLMNTPPSWFTRPCPSGEETGQEDVITDGGIPGATNTLHLHFTFYFTTPHYIFLLTTSVLASCYLLYLIWIYYLLLLKFIIVYL